MKSSASRWAALPLCALALLAASPRAIAHDGVHDQWFMTLRSIAGMACCDGSDAYFVDDPEWETKGDSYRVRLKGQWIDVPPSAIVKQKNIVGYAVVWPDTNAIGATVIRCFLPGASG